ncbi:transposase [Pseudomaricurvus alkylphenolicus]|nr:transposase [Pseudomaricurvus alkylphenolicus]
MSDLARLLFYLIRSVVILLHPGGLKSIAAENPMLRQQLIVMTRSRKRSPTLTVPDRTVLAALSQLISRRRFSKLAIVVQPATILRFHKALIKRKYRILFSAKSRSKPGPKGPDDELIRLVVAIKQKNPRMGYDRITMQVLQAFGVKIDKHVVRRTLAKYYKPPNDNGPSWLTFLAQTKDSLWSLDLFRCESINLKSHWVMVAIDVHTRQLIGFVIHMGDVDGTTACRMFKQILGNHPPPARISTDHDPVFTYHQWRANLRILDIEEVKTVPFVPTSHPFIERAIGTIRREFLDHTLFWNAKDLSRKLKQYKHYFNEVRGHLSLDGMTPLQKSEKTQIPETDIRDYEWVTHCNGLFQLPVAC